MKGSKAYLLLKGNNASNKIFFITIVYYVFGEYITFTI